MELLAEITDRRSIRAFKKQVAEKAKLERILKAGTMAPSAKNRQEWRFIVVQKPALIQGIKDAAFGQAYVGQAPVIVAVCPTNVDYRMPNGQLSYPVDLAFATSFMVLQATRENLGSCVLTTFDEQEVKDLLSIPYSIPVVMLLLIGYADEELGPTPRKTPRQTISANHW